MLISTAEDKIVELILYQAPVEWTEYWLNSMMSEVFDNFKLKGILEIVPFFNELAHYTFTNIANDDGHVPLDQIANLVEEALSEMSNSVWDKAYARLCARHGKPREDA